VPTEPDIELELSNVDLRQDLMTHRYHISRINADMRQLSAMTDVLETRVLSEQVSITDYKTSLAQLRSWLRALQKHILAARKETTILAAKARVRADRDRPLFTRIYFAVRRTRYEKNFGEAVAKEVRVIEREIEENVGASKERLSAIEGDVGNDT
jgi:hypothetical protein